MGRNNLPEWPKLDPKQYFDLPKAIKLTFLD